FEDVPADHWAYDAVAQLAADGFIEGYGDGTYRGDQEITRYEMAQMIARAMAKNPNGADKALVDKLAAEFADELNNLGVRVAALEKKVDNVKWGGKIRYRFAKSWLEGRDGYGDRAADTNGLLLRFEPQMKINEHWTGKARIDYNNNSEMQNAVNYPDANGENGVSVDRIYVQGDYKNLTIKLGKLPYKSQADYGTFMDRYFTGGQVVFGSDILVALNAGRIRNADVQVLSNAAGVSNYLGIEVYNKRSDKFTWGLGYHNYKMQEYNSIAGVETFGDKNQATFAVGLGYKFTPDWSLTGAYNKGLKVDNVESKQKYSYSVELGYKGANAKKQGSWGAFLAYRHLGAQSGTAWHTYRLTNPTVTSNRRGIEIGASWAPMKNVTTLLRYFNGKTLDNQSKKYNAIFNEWNFLF
ncbi:MAG: S-layer homology domain-containing protein, partial [Schwartzia sp.]|nr:S-layer homology domain-containing protein [Schwartzia sp. (in: firmicutes)]